MSMSKKDYVTIANVMRTWELAQRAGVQVQVKDITESLADYFERDNESFDRARFMRLYDKPEARRRPKTLSERLRDEAAAYDAPDDEVLLRQEQGPVQGGGE